MDTAGAYCNDVTHAQHRSWDWHLSHEWAHNAVIRMRGKVIVHRIGVLPEFKFYLSLYVFDWLACSVWISFSNKVSRRDLLNRHCGAYSNVTHAHHRL